MANKVALVTGGTGGIGTVMCKRLAKDGYKAVANYYSKVVPTADAEKWRDDLRKEGYDVHIADGDVTNFASCADMFKKINSEIGQVDILVNNAGITRDAPLHKMTEQQWYDVINTNLNSVFNCSRLVIEGMIAKGWGRIINISSVNGQKGAYGQTNYSSAKSAMYGFAKSLALEVAKKGITVNCISPGYIGTSMVMAIKEEIREKIVAQVPVGRFGSPEEIANMVSYLASDLGAYITGANMAVNGGLHMY
ncbi:MAG: acetoacetyl-CoA reductase [Bacteroidia bacterium]|nr:acetoacetyl-CoA reductase [Bacteroidia bacterium]